MQYISLLNENIDIYPIFGEGKIKNPVFLSMSDESFWLKSLKNEQIKNQEVFNDLIINFGKINNSDLIIYLDTKKKTKKKTLYKNT